MSKIITTKYQSIECDCSLYFAARYEMEEKAELKNGVKHISIRKDTEYIDTGIPIRLIEDMFCYFLEDFSGQDVEVKTFGGHEDEYAISVESFHKAISNLERYIATEGRENGPDSEEELIALMDTDAEGLLKVLKDMDRDADVSDGYIHFKNVKLPENTIKSL